MGINNTQTIGTAAPVYSSSIRTEKASGFFLTNQVTVNTPSPATFTAAAATDLCTAVAHGMLTGLVVRVSTTTTLPGGLAAATDYFVISLSADTFKLATSLVNAQAGTAIDITDAGTGTHTVTPTALAGASFKLYASLDDVTYFDLGISTAITTTANFIYEKVDPKYSYLKVYYTLTSGQISAVQSIGIDAENI